MASLVGLAALLMFAGCSGSRGEDDAMPGGILARPVGAAQTQGQPTPFQARKIEDLLGFRLSCLGCHTLDDEGGRIGPDLSNVGMRLDAEAIRAKIRNPRGVFPTSVMPRVPMPPPWEDLLVAYLAGRGKSAGGDATPPSQSASTERVASGSDATIPAPADMGIEDLYRAYCGTCHGVEGDGNGSNAPFLSAPPTAHADPALMSVRPDAVLFDAIYAGGYIMNKSHHMPPFGETLSREQIWALVAYIRELCGCQGPEWSRDGR